MAGAKAGAISLGVRGAVSTARGFAPLAKDRR
jgi:hypothetical protein